MSIVWVFNGPKSQFPSGVFTERDAAERWIRQHGLSGTLTAYPVDVGTYDWAVGAGTSLRRETTSATRSSFSALVLPLRSIIIMRMETRPNALRRTPVITALVAIYASRGRVAEIGHQYDAAAINPEGTFVRTGIVLFVPIVTLPNRVSENF